MMNKLRLLEFIYKQKMPFKEKKRKRVKKSKKVIVPRGGISEGCHVISNSFFFLLSIK